jgi:hypothetical protein
MEVNSGPVNGLPVMAFAEEETKPDPDLSEEKEEVFR